MDKRTLSLDYLAGFFDGEGSVSIIRTLPKRRRERGWNPHYYLRVAVSGTDPRIVNAFCDRFGGSVHFVERRSERHSPVYVWVAQQNIAEGFLSQIVGLLEIKHQDAEIGLEFQALIR